MLFQNSMTFFFPVEYKIRYFEKCLGFSPPPDTMEVNGNQNNLVPEILQNIFFCISQKKENDMRLSN